MDGPPKPHSLCLAVATEPIHPCATELCQRNEAAIRAWFNLPSARVTLLERGGKQSNCRLVAEAKERRGEGTQRRGDRKAAPSLLACQRTCSWALASAPRHLLSREQQSARGPFRLLFSANPRLGLYSRVPSPGEDGAACFRPPRSEGTDKVVCPGDQILLASACQPLWLVRG